jgi:DNA (cytosine-5)-methyltransferase 1
MNELALFAGAGGGILGGHLLGWRTVCAVEWEPYPASVLVARQNDGILPPFPIWDDVQTFDGFAWRGLVDVVSGGFPCQDISAAGKGAGIEGQRSGMWSHMARIIREVDPAFAFIENSPMLRTRGLGTVLNDLNSMGFDAKWGCISASAVGANHKRDRIWIVGKSKRKGLEGQWSQPGQQEVSQPRDAGSLADSNCMRELQPQRGQQEQRGRIGNSSKELAYTKNSRDVWRQWSLGFAQQEHDSRGSQIDGCRKWWEAEPNVGRVDHGVAARVDRLKAIGNGQVPLCAATAWRLLSS